MNNKLLKLALDAHLLNYVEHETPRHYFIDGYADTETVEDFAKLLITAVLSDIRSEFLHLYSYSDTLDGIIADVKSEYLE